jgi:hypothetical protein
MKKSFGLAFNLILEFSVMFTKVDLLDRQVHRISFRLDSSQDETEDPILPVLFLYSVQWHITNVVGFSGVGAAKGKLFWRSGSTKFVNLRLTDRPQQTARVNPPSDVDPCPGHRILDP